MQRATQLVWTVLLMPATWVLYVSLRLFNVVRPVRIGTLNEKGRLSIMVSYIEPYLRRLQLDGVRRPLVIVINPGLTPNDYLAHLYRSSVWLLDDTHPHLRHLFALMHRLLAARSPLAASLRHGYTHEFADVWQRGAPSLRFTAAEHAAGAQLLCRLGVADGAAHICFGLRDAAYYRQFLTSEAQARHPNAEASEDTYIRNPQMVNYLPMASRCAALGLFVLRMGQVVGAPLPPDLPPGIVDYAWKQRTQFGDVYLLGTCAFVVAGGAGLWWVASAFNRPVILTDSYYLQFRGLRAGDLFIPQLCWLRSERRFLTFREMLSAGMRYSYASSCRRDGVELVHNTADDIEAVAMEMHQRLQGTWRAQDEDEELQRRFNALYEPGHMGYGMPGRIGTAFLRQHAPLLDDRGARSSRPAVSVVNAAVSCG